MTLIAFALALLVVILVARVVVRFIGWPTSLEAMKRWVLALLGLAVFFVGLPELLRAFGPKLGSQWSVELTELVPALCVLGLAVLGYVGSRRATEAREREAQATGRTKFMVRKRATPPPPGFAGDGGFTPVGFDGGQPEEE